MLTQERRRRLFDDLVKNAIGAGAEGPGEVRLTRGFSQP
jgi:hypothetical protein